MPDQTSKDRPNPLKFERYSSLFGCCTCANRHVLINKGPPSSRFPYIYAYCRYRTTGFIVEINRRAPKPLHSHTALLLGHIRYIENIGIASLIVASLEIEESLKMEGS